MKAILAILLTAALTFLTGLFAPWWSIAIVAFLVALLVKVRFGLAFVCGFLGVFICWGLLAFWIDVKNNHVLSKKIAQILPLSGSSLLLILITGIVGGLVGGFAALSGSSLRKA